MSECAIDTTDDGFLGGRLVLRQPKRGHRAGHDAILLAASTHASATEGVVDLGAGIGTAGLALAKRVDGVEPVLVEIDPALAELAAFNAQTNSIAARVVVADVTAQAALSGLGLADRVLMNPPFHPPTQPPSPDAARRLAHASDSNTLKTWVRAAHRLLKPRGTMTMIWRADDLADLLAAVGAQFGSLALQPVYGSPNKPAVRILLRAVKCGRAPLALYRPAVLDGSDEVVERAMRGEGVLALAERAQA